MGRRNRYMNFMGRSSIFHSTTDEHMACFCLGTVMSSSAIYTLWGVFWHTCASISGERVPWHGINCWLIGHMCLAFSRSSDSKASAKNAGDPSSTSGSRRCPGEGNGNPLLYPCLENPMDRGAWRATVHGIAKSWIWQSNYTHTHTHTHTHTQGICVQL